MLELIRRFWFMLNRRRFERSLEDEMEFHREMMSRAGRTGFGNTLRLREEARDAWGWLWLDFLWRDFQHGLRILRKSPGFAMAAVNVLSLAIGGTTAMFSVIHSTLLNPLPFRDPERLVLARCTWNGQFKGLVSAPDYYDYRAQTDRFSGFSAVLAGDTKATAMVGAEPLRATTAVTEHDLFRTLGVSPAPGRWFSDEEGRPGGPPAVVLGWRFAQRHFGAAEKAAGAALAINGSVYTVVGVAPANLHLFRDVDVWLSMQRGVAAAGIGRQFHNWLIVGRLKPGVPLAAAQRQVDVISKRLERQYPDSNRGEALRLDPLRSALTETQAPRLVVLMCAVSMLLLVACANVAGLLLARGSARRAELAMRAALGASRARITGQLLVENVTLTLLAGMLGTVLSLWLGRLLPQAIGLGAVETPHRLAWQVWLFALALSVATGILCGVAPALRPLSNDLIASARMTAAKSGASLRAVLVVCQVAVSVVLLIGASLLIRSFARLAATDPGFEVPHLLTGELDLASAQYAERDKRIQFLDALRGDLAAVPGVEGSGFISSLPIRNPGFNLTVWDTAHPPAGSTERLMAFRRVVLPGYFEALGIPLHAGRDLGKRDRENAPLSMVIDERMARTLFPGRNPIGQCVSVDLFGQQPTFEVVGVVADVRVDSIDDGSPLTMYLSYYQFPDKTMRFAIRTHQTPESITDTVRRLVLARDRTVAVENMISMERIIGETLAPAQTTTILLALLAVFAVLLAAIGLYGVLAYSVAQRTREIGVRMALGAKAGMVLRMVMKQGAALAASGVSIGLVAAMGLSHLIRALLYEVQPGDPLTFSAVPAGLFAVALLATYVPARRAANVDPIQALRQD